jgi:hypothetical protein
MAGLAQVECELTGHRLRSIHDPIDDKLISSPHICVLPAAPA